MKQLEELYHLMDYMMVRGFANHDDAMFLRGLMIQFALSEVGQEEDDDTNVEKYMDFYHFTAQDKIAFCDKIIEETDKLRLQIYPEWESLYNEIFVPIPKPTIPEETT